MKYSVIIPVYNAEKTLRRCVDSLLDQGSPDAEIILVNDGSKDGSAAICEEYAKNYDCVRFISQPNGGVSSARNAGLDIASGEYVLFVDSDDYVAPSYFSIIDQTVNQAQADFTQFSCRIAHVTSRPDAVHEPFRAYTREKLLPRIVDSICRKTINGPHAKVYLRKIIEEHNVRFPVGSSIGEDRVFNIVYTFFIQSYAASDAVVYFIDTGNENSLSRKRYQDLNKQFEIANEYYYEQLAAAELPESEKESYQRAINFGTCRGIYHDAKLMIADRIGWFKRQKTLLQLCRNINKKHMRYPRTRYCTLITLPVRLYLALVIDAVAQKLTRGAS